VSKTLKPELDEFVEKILLKLPLTKGIWSKITQLKEKFIEEL